MHITADFVHDSYRRIEFQSLKHRLKITRHWSFESEKEMERNETFKDKNKRNKNILNGKWHTQMNETFQIGEPN